MQLKRHTSEGGESRREEIVELAEELGAGVDSDGQQGGTEG